jgi:hypothetical protein
MALSADQMTAAVEAEIRATFEAELASRLEGARSLVGAKLEEQVATATQRLNDRRSAIANDEAELSAAVSELEAFRASQVPVEQVQG